MTQANYSQYKYFEDERTKDEILLTNHLAHALTTINLNRLNQKTKTTPTHHTHNHIKK